MSADLTHKAPNAVDARSNATSANQLVANVLFRPHPYTFSVQDAQDGQTEGDARDAAHFEGNGLQETLNSNTEHVETGPSQTDGLTSSDRPGHDFGAASVEDGFFVTQDDEVRMTDGLSHAPEGQTSNLNTPSILAAFEQICNEYVRDNPWLISDSRSEVLQPLAINITSSSEQRVDEPAEIALFLRSFAENIAHGRLIRYAACAAAAKQLGHAKDDSYIFKATLSQHSVLNRRRRDGKIDYLWYGAKYYGKAIQAMAAEILNGHDTGQTVTSTATPSSVDIATTQSNGPVMIEARVTAAIIMCQYEELSGSCKAWSRHLDGILRLLRLDDTARAGNRADHPSPLPLVCAERWSKAVFWPFVLNDIEEAFVSSRPTRIDTADLDLWRTMGLPVGMHGALQLQHSTDSFAPANEMMVQFATLWLLARTVNHVATKVRSSASPESAEMVSPGVGNSTTDFWRELNHEVYELVTSLPQSFEPDVSRARFAADDSSGQSLFSTETWFASATSAIVKAHLGMINILLLLHKPGELMTEHSMPRQDWLQALRALRMQLSEHAKGIFSIMLGATDDAVRMHMLQPLYVAGRPLTRSEDQRQLVEMLKRIEWDLGIATGYRVKTLIQEWGIDTLHGVSELDDELSDVSSNVG
ncbi:hypothetical protein PRZ48_011827 [Zasmidium cellare]|uniref:Transcription factor domain-containing protein n=1 Tax=Zasmidium cellare TaxID=395010 RepID=A0ABR0E835_ZASCE|nr:hypothetical protein PRZ48_011827 [Zasmidium cellare]